MSAGDLPEGGLRLNKVVIAQCRMYFHLCTLFFGYSPQGVHEAFAITVAAKCGLFGEPKHQSPYALETKRGFRGAKKRWLYAVKGPAGAIGSTQRPDAAATRQRFQAPVDALINWTLLGLIVQWSF